MPKYTILLIDYEPRSIERFRQPLLRAGYVVELAVDGVAGIEAFHRIQPDLVLVEAMIPKRHGFEVCQEIKKTSEGKRTPVLITTAVYKGRRYRTQALHIYGCDEYVEKPITEEDLLGIVSRHLGDRKTTPFATEAAARTSGATAVPAHPADAGDSTEQEILARLEAIMPQSSPPLAGPAADDADPCPRPEASRNEVAGLGDPQGELVLFDPSRSRRHRRAVPPEAGSGSREGEDLSAAQAAAQPARAWEPDPEPVSPVRETLPQKELVMLPPVETRGPSAALWIWLGVAVAVLIAGWLLSWSVG